MFAEMFNEMLQQRFGRAILRALAAIDASKVKRSSSRREAKDKDGKEDSSAPAPSSASKKRERDASAEPSTPKDVEMPDVDKQQPGGGDSDAAKRQKTEQAADGE